MTQLEKFIARLKSLDPSSLYRIVVYVTPDGQLGFWIVDKESGKIEGEQRENCDKMSKGLANNQTTI